MRPPRFRGRSMARPAPISGSNSSPMTRAMIPETEKGRPSEGPPCWAPAEVPTDGSGNAAINAALPVALTGTKFITATATNSATHDTSEFSKCLQATVLVAEDCTNGTDDDGDGLADCNDPNCSTDPACSLEVSGSGCNLDNLHSASNTSAQFLPLLAMAGIWLMRKRI